MENYPWWKLDQINKYSAYVETLLTWELQQCVEMIERRKHRVTETVSGFVIANPGQGLGFHNFPEWEELKRLEAIVKAEIEKRQTPAPPAKPGSKGKEKAPPELPPLIEMLLEPETLNLLYGYLSKRQIKDDKGAEKRLLFQSGIGFTGSRHRNAAPIMGVAAGLVKANQVKPGFNKDQVYRALCLEFGTTATPQRSKSEIRPDFKRVLIWTFEFYTDRG